MNKKIKGKKLLLVLDLDGVFVNLKNDMERLVGKPYDEINQDDWAKMLYETSSPKGENFWLQLPKFDWADDLFTELKRLSKLYEFDMIFCSSKSTKRTNCSKKVELEKKLWVINNIDSDIEVFTSDSAKQKAELVLKEKPNYDFYLIIDDFIEQVNFWNSKMGDNGSMILFNNYKETENILKQLLFDWKKNV